MSLVRKVSDLLQNKTDIDQYSEVLFHNTQPNCIQALVFFIARYNREVKQYNQDNPHVLQKNTVKLVNHFTDMPTRQAEIFIEEMKKIDSSDLYPKSLEMRALCFCFFRS